VPLSDRLEARRRETGEVPDEPASEVLDYEQLATELADRVSRLGSFRGHSDRARILHQLTEIDRRVHTLLAQVGGKPAP
jgi:hypothetical protein